jgi:hypothetical protein
MLSPQLRQRLDPLLRRFSGGRLYYAYQLERAEYVGTTNRELSTVVDTLRAAGYESPPTLGPIPLEAAKTRPGDDRPHDCSLRRVDPERPACHWHVHLWSDSNGVSLFSHYEYRSDFKQLEGETVGDAYERLSEHLSPSWGTSWGDGTTYVMGKTDITVRTLF